MAEPGARPAHWNPFYPRQCPPSHLSEYEEVAYFYNMQLRAHPSPTEMNLSLLLLALEFYVVYGGLWLPCGIYYDLYSGLYSQQEQEEDEYWMCVPRTETCLKVSDPCSLNETHYYAKRSICEGRCKSRVDLFIEHQI
ncbi:unnamed protein product [Cylicocyclus nassatus]|uniref:Uncharacterized protein n=1 Tax=Cylicocyclus nassatus TaxID=53992 RepID=A0AA36GVY9_CYLNA|nr:unnamed protein product [Cylicocyclus nassatus]